MLDIKFVRENPDKVKENIKNKFQEEKLSLAQSHQFICQKPDIRTT